MTAYPWKPTDPVYCRYFDITSGGYIGKLAGHVTAVGKAGVTIRRVTPDHEGKWEQRLGFHDVWPSKQAVDAAIALNPTPNYRNESGTK